MLDLSEPHSQYAGRLLANLGADVIKIEPPAGDSGRRIGPFLDDIPGPERSLFWWYYNADKRSLALDLATDDGLDLFVRLAAEADVVLETAQPTAQRPFDPVALAEQFPRLVVLSLTPFGQDGPWAEWAWSDGVGLALGGPMGSCGYDNLEGAPPIRPTEHHAGTYRGLLRSIRRNRRALRTSGVRARAAHRRLDARGLRLHHRVVRPLGAL